MCEIVPQKKKTAYSKEIMELIMDTLYKVFIPTIFHVLLFNLVDTEQQKNCFDVKMISEIEYKYKTSAFTLFNMTGDMLHVTKVCN